VRPIGPGGIVELGDRLSIRKWCQTHQVHSLVVVKTKSGEHHLDCDTPEITFTDRAPPDFRPPPGRMMRTAPTITSELQTTIQALAGASKQLASLESPVRFRQYGPGPQPNTSVATTNSPIDPNDQGRTASYDERALERRMAEKKGQVAALCTKLWEQRNLIYKSNGYCFKEARAVAAFGNAGCIYSNEVSLPLPSEAREVIRTSIEAERLYCK
jgi:hypothetical protein